ANARAGFTFLSIYENLTIPPDKIINAITTLKTPLHQNVLHALTSAAAATSFVQFYNDATKEEKTKFRISTFGLSATEILVDKGFNPYHRSDAPTFDSYIDELLGKTTLMQI
ncbi:MAG TPA: hypothetical protein PLY93_08825, partial [Turneriella sp.]|nr:hypothetical protein [Turneriella sp.]